MIFVVYILSKSTTIVFFASLSFLALKEFLFNVPMRTVDRRAVFLYLSIPVQYYWVNTAWYGMFHIIFLLMYFFLFPFAWCLSEKLKVTQSPERLQL